MCRARDTASGPWYVIHRIFSFSSTNAFISLDFNNFILIKDYDGAGNRRKGYEKDETRAGARNADASRAPGAFSSFLNYTNVYLDHHNDDDKVRVPVCSPSRSICIRHC